MGETATLRDLARGLKRIEEKMVSREEIESLITTWEALHDPKTLESLRRAEADIRAGRVRTCKSVKDILG
jgi:uncharacterized ferredoxin-like protein